MENAIEPITLYTYVNDTAPARHFAITRQDTGPVDLSGAMVDFYIQNPYDKNRTNTGHTACIIDDAINGKCTYSWQDGDLPVEGIYDANIRIVYPSGQKETAPVSIEVAAIV